MKILLAHDFYQNAGGEDAAVLAERELLERAGHEVLFYSRHNDELRAAGPATRLALAASMLYSRRTSRDIEKLVHKERPDVAYVHNFFPLISGSIYHALHALRVPVVQAVHNFRFFCPIGTFYTENQICERCQHGNYLHSVRHRCYRDSTWASLGAATIAASNRFTGVLDKISAFVCLTEFSKLKLTKLGIPGERLFVKPHSLDAACVQPRWSLGTYVLYLGRLSPEKGLWTLVRAFERMPQVPLRIAGTGPLEHDLREYIRARSLTNIEALGFQSGQEKWRLIQNSMLVVVPSEWYETFCLTVIEGYAAGKPVLGSNLGSLPHVIEEGRSGLLFRPASPEDLREKVQYLLDHPDLARTMGRYGRHLVETKYHPEENYRSLMRVFSAVCSN